MWTGNGRALFFCFQISQHQSSFNVVVVAFCPRQTENAAEFPWTNGWSADSHLRQFTGALLNKINLSVEQYVQREYVVQRS